MLWHPPGPSYGCSNGVWTALFSLDTAFGSFSLSLEVDPTNVHFFCFLDSSTIDVFVRVEGDLIITSNPLIVNTQGNISIQGDLVVSSSPLIVQPGGSVSIEGTNHVYYF